ncbi:uncharacterized protein LY79DRAFT_534868 [Colletotrichum navitas]|uniref:Uncharacterized protein n=1 Tax=Colletotrichum navitas TaxID=681940 RepID=A0AAD8QDK6_9PEZI|nr:uncharacterized protein LY79DRAFT_534868 [Colletotrichum navitas]KAK1599368.1 hypothetical protein LY79DRAFT_534868 [Colletotrichum navitas]
MLRFDPQSVCLLTATAGNWVGGVRWIHVSIEYLFLSQHDMKVLGTGGCPNTGSPAWAG